MTPAQCPEIETWKLLLQAIGFAGGWFIVIIGWFIANSHAKKREYRKEVRGFIEEMKGQLDEVRTAAIEFWGKDGDQAEEGEAIQITVRLSRLSLALNRLERVTRIDCRDRMIPLRQAISGSDFYSKARKSSDHFAQRQNEIGAAANDLEQALEDGFFEKYDKKRVSP